MMVAARHGRWTAALLAPSVGLIGIFVLVPMALTVWLSFHRWSTQTGFGDATWIGLGNYDAARIDGARPARLFRSITLPLLRRTLLFSGVIALINAVQVFEPVALITQGGPIGSTNVMTYHIRRVGIERAQGGLGSAMAVALLLALVVAVAAAFALARREPEA